MKNIRSMVGRIREQMGMLGADGNPFEALKMPHIPQAALAGAGSSNVTNTNNKTTNLGGVHITVNGYNVRNDDELARVLADKINGMMEEDDAVFK